MRARARARRAHPAAAAEQKGEKRREGGRESEGGNVFEEANADAALQCVSVTTGGRGWEGGGLGSGRSLVRTGPLLAQF